MKIIAVLFLFLFGVNADEIKIKIKEIPVAEAVSGDRLTLLSFGFGSGKMLDSATSRAHNAAAANMLNMASGADFEFSSGTTMRAENSANLKDMTMVLKTVLSTNPYNVLVGLSMPGKPIKQVATRQGAFKASFTLSDPGRFSFDLDKSIARATQMYLKSKKVTDTKGKYYVQDINLVKHKRKQQFKVELTVVMMY